ADAARHLGAVGELGDPARADERADLDRAEAGVGERVDEHDLLVGGDEARFVLQPVARADLVDGDPRGVARHRCPPLGGRLRALPDRTSGGARWGPPSRATRSSVTSSSVATTWCAADWS